MRDSDGTVVFSLAGKLSGGSLATAAYAKKHGKPLLHLYAGVEAPETDLLRFLQDNNIRKLNVAGPRASEEPGVAAFVRTVLQRMWAKVSKTNRGTVHTVEKHPGVQRRRPAARTSQRAQEQPAMKNTSSQCSLAFPIY